MNEALKTPTLYHKQTFPVEIDRYEHIFSKVHILVIPDDFPDSGHGLWEGTEIS